MEYYSRNLFKKILKWLDRKEILAIKGPRQSGKTTILEMIENELKARGIKNITRYVVKKRMNKLLKSKYK